MNEKIILIAMIVVGALGIGWAVYWATSFECSEGHYEKQWRMPAGVVVGGNGQGYGGVSVPMGNAREVDVWVCDVYARK